MCFRSRWCQKRSHSSSSIRTTTSHPPAQNKTSIQQNSRRQGRREADQILCQMGVYYGMFGILSSSKGTIMYIILRQSVLSGLTFLLLLLVTNPTKHIPKEALKEKNGNARGHKHHNNCPIHYATEQLRRNPSTEVQRPAHFADEPPAAGNAGLGMPATPTRQSPRNKRAKRHD